MKPVLLDTGVIIALLDRKESYHQVCKGVVEQLEVPLVTCEAVIAESCYLLRGIPGAADTVLKNVSSGAFHLGFDLSIHVERVRKLLEKYKDVPMDFADACLVCLAEDFESGDILTLDSDFLVYRFDSRRKFRNLIRLAK